MYRVSIYKTVFPCTSDNESSVHGTNRANIPQVSPSCCGSYHMAYMVPLSCEYIQCHVILSSNFPRNYRELSWTSVYNVIGRYQNISSLN